MHWSGTPEITVLWMPFQKFVRGERPRTPSERSLLPNALGDWKQAPIFLNHCKHFIIQIWHVLERGGPKKVSRRQFIFFSLAPLRSIRIFMCCAFYKFSLLVSCRMRLLTAWIPSIFGAIGITGTDVCSGHHFCDLPVESDRKKAVVYHVQHIVPPTWLAKKHRCYFSRVLSCLRQHRGVMQFVIGDIGPCNLLYQIPTILAEYMAF